MSNQLATHNRVTLLESIEAARNSIERLIDFHKAEIEFAIWKDGDWNDFQIALWRLWRVEIRAAQREAWGDGP